MSVLDAFKPADQVLLSGVQGITDLITTPGLINLDFADVKSVMSGAGSALMGIGSSRGDDRAVAAAEMAISSPLLEASIDGAHGVLLSIQGGSDLGLFEINEAAQLVSNSAAVDANIIFGAVIDDALGDEVRVTVIAAGFDEQRPSRRRPPPRSAASRSPVPVPAARAAPAGALGSAARPAGGSPAWAYPARVWNPLCRWCRGVRRVASAAAADAAGRSGNGTGPRSPRATRRQPLHGSGPSRPESAAAPGSLARLRPGRRSGSPARDLPASRLRRAGGRGRGLTGAPVAVQRAGRRRPVAYVPAPVSFVSQDEDD